MFSIKLPGNQAEQANLFPTYRYSPGKMF